MLQHQLRGVFTVVDDCSFRVSRLDMLSGYDVHWWGAMTSDFENMTDNGLVISDQKLNQTFNNESFIVHLLDNVTWDKLGVVSVWDLPTTSDFGHVLLSNATNPKPKPLLIYPNPPNPSKVLYINKKEAPVLRVERGVPMKFAKEAGHDVSFYITSDFLGGNASLRNRTETIYAGGQETHGVLSSPLELVWAPNRNTPDQLYYHSVFQEKMGWKVQVVDGGLSDMYNNSVNLDDQQVKFFWTIIGDSISIAARGKKKSGYLAIGFGSEMANSYAYAYNT